MKNNSVWDEMMDLKWTDVICIDDCNAQMNMMHLNYYIKLILLFGDIRIVHPSDQCCSLLLQLEWHSICLIGNQNKYLFAFDTRILALKLVAIMDFEVIFFSNGDVSEEFTMDEHYVGHARNRPAPSFHVTVDYYESYVVLICLRDEKHPKQIWLVKILLSPNFVPTSPNNIVRVIGRNKQIL